jgi:hypothetical protein
VSEPSTITVYINDDDRTTVLTENDMDEQFQETLNERYPDGIDIIGYTYDAARLLKDADPIAYHETYLGYLDSLLRDDEWHEVEMPWDVWVTFNADTYAAWIDANLTDEVNA